MRILVPLLASCLAAASFAQPAAPLASRPPVVLVTQDKAKVPIHVSELRAQVAIVGSTARTRLEMVFRNANDRVLEGELVFPLPAGTTVSGYGLDIEGEIVDASAVGRTEARVAFEAEVRKTVDPGLVEWVKGNVFRTRVYPLPAKGQRTIRVEYVQHLTGEPAVYQLPIQLEQATKLSLQVEVHGCEAAPKVLGTAPAGFAFAGKGRHFAAEADSDAGKLAGDLRIDLGGLRPLHTQVEARPERGRDAHYALISAAVDPSKEAEAPLTAKRLRVYWDASLSRRSGQLERELDFLERALKRFGGLTEVTVVRFRGTIEAPKAFAYRGDAKLIRAYLAGTRYDGASDLARLPLAQPKLADANLLFTDGLATLGEAVKAPAAPTYTINSAAAAGHGLLARLADQSGGRAIDLARLTPEAGAARLAKVPVLLEGVEVEPKGALIDVVPARAVVDGRALVLGRLAAAQATVTLRFRGAAPVRVTLRQGDATGTGLVPQLWAAREVESLLADPDRNRDRITRLGKTFALVTPFTSLLVLETLEQHLTHGVLPAKSRAKLREQYLVAIEKRTAQAAQSRAARLAKVKTLWQQRLAWWNKEFTYPANYKHEAKEQKKRAESRSADMDDARPAAPARSLRRMAGGAVAGKKDSKNAGGATAPRIKLAPWDPNKPYLVPLKQAESAEAAYAAYLAGRAKHGGSPAFYLDCAEHFVRVRKRLDLGLRLLGSILELELDSAPLLRVVAHRFEQLGALDRAIDLFEQVRRWRPEEPQSHRDLALALGERGRQTQAKYPGRAQADYRRALGLLAQVIEGDWHGRFPGIQVIALTEHNELLVRERNTGGDADIYTPKLSKDLLQATPVDVRILLTWDADATDIDLWVTEPSGEKCMYNHNRTHIGGMMTNDFTQGYGPEVYLLKKTMPGSYKIQCNFYGSSQQKLTGGVTIQATVITNFGRPNEQRQKLTVRVEEKKEVITLGEVTFE